MEILSKRWLIGLLSLVSVLLLSIPAQAHLGHEHQEIPIDARQEAVQPATSAIAGAVQIQLDAQPPLSQIVPAHQPVRLKLQASDSQQKPLPQAQWQITLHTPARTPWLSTDFPIVEGSTLLHSDRLTAEELEMETILPIRGNYRLQTTVTAPGLTAPVAQSFELNVPENPIKYRNAVTLAVILLGVGLLGGYLIAKQAQSNAAELSPSVRLLLSGAALVAIAAMLTVNISAERAGHSHVDPLFPGRSSAESGSLKLEYLGETIATVGQLADLSVRFVDTRTNQPIANGTVRLQARNDEHGVTVLSIAGKSDAQGLFIWQQQFFDGAPHQLEIEAVAPTGSAAVTLTQEIDVEGIAPPLSVRLITLSYMTAIAAIGMAIGLGTARLQGRSRRLKGTLKPDAGRLM